MRSEVQFGVLFKLVEWYQLFFIIHKKRNMGSYRLR